jgi:hypothetical protein
MNGKIAALGCPLDAQNVAAGCAGLGYRERLRDPQAGVRSWIATIRARLENRPDPVLASRRREPKDEHLLENIL